MKGKLITFEGIDGSGKTTVCKKVYEELKKKMRIVLVTEPTKTWLGDAVRRVMDEKVSPFTGALLFMADHANLVEKIKEYLDNGTNVICDRYNDSSYAYQGVELKNILAEYNIDAVEYLMNIQKPFTITPNLTFLFVIEPEIAMKRISYRKKTKFEKAQFLKNVQNVYLGLAENEKRYRKIDANREIDEVVNECVREIENTIVGRE
ncbi:MAG: dTMP kinase [Thermoplasmatales archaeon]|nr:dTMP kinase [Thermoplasmatales archaeon]